MDILIVANFTGDFKANDNGRFKYLAEMLSAQMNDVEIITSSFDHDTKRSKGPICSDLPYKITYLHEPGYPKNVCLKRFYSHFTWGQNVKRYLKKRKKPDVIYCAVPSLTAPNIVSRYCEKEKIRFVIDVQDLWPEAFQMVLNVPIVSDLLFAPFKALANGIYKRADAICAVSNTYCQRAASVNHKCNNTTTVFLGTELTTFDKYASENPILEKNENDIWLAYCGTLGSSYDLNCVIDAMAQLHSPHLSFIVMGDGPRKDEFEKYAKTKNVKAVFVGRLPYNVMCSLLCACDITVNPIAHMAAQSIINKHADYAMSGKPVLNTQESEEYRKLIDDYHMGFNCKNNNAQDLAEKLEILISDPKLRSEMGENARRCAEERFDRTVAYHLIENQILVNQGGGITV